MLLLQHAGKGYQESAQAEAPPISRSNEVSI